MTVRTRFAPSPTGELHLGNARTAALNWLFARHHQGRFIVRFEDTDVERHVDEAEATILESLDWLGLDRDEDTLVGGDFGPYRQSERLDLYRERAERLLEGGAAFRCYCLPEELEERRRAALAAGGSLGYDGRCRDLTPDEAASFRAEGRQPTVRFRVAAGPITVEDRVRGEVTIDGADFGDFVILRSDGRPTYNFAVVVDDVAMEITHVIRGIGHLSNTPKQVLLYRAFDAELPQFVHHPMILAAGGGKLSKREGAPGLLSYRDAGYHPEAVLNYLSLLSWSSEGGEEFFTREALVEQIDLDRIGATNAELDLEKMRWLSGRHIRAESSDALARRLEPFVPREAYGLTDRDLHALADVIQGRIMLLSDVREEAAAIYGEPDLGAEPSVQALAGESAGPVLEAVRDAWSGAEWRPEVLHEAMKRAGSRAGAAGRSLYQPVRVALTGRLKGAELPGVAYALGRERCLARLEAARHAVRSIHGG